MKQSRSKRSTTNKKQRSHGTSLFFQARENETKPKPTGHLPHSKHRGTSLLDSLSLSICMCLSAIYLSIYLSIYVPIYLSMSIYTYIYIHTCIKLPIYLSIHLSISLSPSLSLSFLFSLSVSLSLPLSLSLWLCRSTQPHASSFFIYVSLFLFSCLSLCLCLVFVARLILELSVSTKGDPVCHLVNLPHHEVATDIRRPLQLSPHDSHALVIRQTVNH